jgi:hypothetical protein
LETYISNSLIQHAILVDNGHTFDPAEKAMAFRRGLSHNERYRSVSITWAANSTFEEQCSWIRTAVSNDNDYNRNVRTADDRRINRADNGPRPAPARRPARSSSAPRKVVKGAKLPKSGIELHSGQYSKEDIQLLRQHGEYDEMVAFRAKHAPPRMTNAVSTSDRQDGDAVSVAGHSVHSTGSRSQFSTETASMHPNDRGMAMVVTADCRRIPLPGTFDFSTHRRINNDPAWMADPRFVSESHAAHSRQHSKPKLGSRWQAASNRINEAVVVAPKATPTPKAPPTKKPTMATRNAIPKSVEIPGKKPFAKKKPPPTPAPYNPVGYSSSSDSDDSVRCMGRAKHITLPAGTVPLVLPVAAPALAAPAASTSTRTTDVTATTFATSAPTDAAVAEEYDSLFDTEPDSDADDAGRDHANIASILANKDKKPAAVSTIALRKRKAANTASKSAPKAAPSMRKRKAPPPRSYSPVVVRNLRPKKR